LKNTQISDLIKIHPVGVELFHVERWTDGWMDRQTDVTNLIVTVCNFANVPKTDTQPFLLTET